MAKLTHADVTRRLAELPGWSLGGEGRSIERDWTLPDFRSAISFVERVAELAEQANHHPDILVHGWNKVRLELSTHSDGGLTEADFALAQRLQTLP